MQMGRQDPFMGIFLPTDYRRPGAIPKNNGYPTAPSGHIQPVGMEFRSNDQYIFIHPALNILIRYGKRIYKARTLVPYIQSPYRSDPQISLHKNPRSREIIIGAQGCEYNKIN